MHQSSKTKKQNNQTHKQTQQNPANKHVTHKPIASTPNKIQPPKQKTK